MVISMSCPEMPGVYTLNPAFPPHLQAPARGRDRDSSSAHALGEDSRSQGGAQSRSWGHRVWELPRAGQRWWRNQSAQNRVHCSWDSPRNPIPSKVLRLSGRRPQGIELPSLLSRPRSHRGHGQAGRLGAWCTCMYPLHMQTRVAACSPRALLPVCAGQVVREPSPTPVSACCLRQSGGVTHKDESSYVWPFTGSLSALPGRWSYSCESSRALWERGTQCSVQVM